MLTTLGGYMILLLSVLNINCICFFSERLVVVAEHCERSLEDLLRERKPVRYWRICNKLVEWKLASKGGFYLETEGH